jgi:urease accessory protein
VDSAGTTLRPLTGGDRRHLDVVGRHARLELVFGSRDGRTVLEDAYAEPPFRIPNGQTREEGLAAILAWSAPGLFGGDVLEQTIRVKRGARLHLTSQSAVQVHSDSTGRAAILRSLYEVEEGAALRCHWDPLIPFAGARLEHGIEIRIAEDAHLYWSDGLMAGRQARGERWMFASLAHEFRLVRGESLVYLERYRLSPLERSVARPWVAADASYFGTTLVSDASITDETARRLHEELAHIEGIRAAADVLECGVLLVRLMGGRGPSFHRARALVGDWAGLEGRPSRVA